MSLSIFNVFEEIVIMIIIYQELSKALLINKLLRVLEERDTSKGFLEERPIYEKS